MFLKIVLLVFCLIFSLNAKIIGDEKLDSDKTYFLNTISIKSDIPFNNQEFEYLTELKRQKYVTKNKISQAYKNLSLKNKFSDINISINKINDNKIDMNFNLHANWIFKKLKIKGIWFGVYNYANLYQQQPGDIFDINSHEESIESIKNYLHNKGYFNCEIKDELIYNKKNKSISTTIRIKKNKKSSINSISLEILDNKSDLTIKIINEIKQKISKHIINYKYSKKLIIKTIKKIKKKFIQKGFTYCRILTKRLINNKTNKVQIVFQIKLGKRKILAFHGNKLFSDKEIKEKILGPDYPSWLYSPEIIAEQLLNEYYKAGYRTTIIKYKKEKDDVLVFNIIEGNPITINNIEIQDEKNNIILNKNYFFYELLKRKFFNDAIFEQAINQLKKHYYENGFWNTSIIKTKFIKQKNNIYNILLKIKPGIQRIWAGCKINNFEQLEKEIPQPETTYSNLEIPFNIYWIQEQKNYIRNYFQKKGFWQAKICPKLEISYKQNEPNKHFVFIKWKVTPGQQIKFGKTLIRGNTKLPFKRIIKELQFKEGELWNKQKLDQTRKQLKKLNIFKHVQLQQQKITADDNKESINQPVILTLIDDDQLQTSLRFGYFLTSKNFLFKRESTYKVGGSIYIKNPTNYADTLSLNADLTHFDRKLNLDYQIPSPFGFSIKNATIIGKLKCYVNKYTNPVEIKNSESAYEAYQNGFHIGINNEYKQDYFWGINIGNEWLRTSRVRGNLKYDEDLINKTLPFFYVEPKVIIDKLDDKLNTKKGSLTFFSLKLMIPENKSITTGKLMAEQSFFYTMFNKITTCIRIRFGHILRREFDEIQPVERFFLGGPYSVRGYEKDAIPPLGETQEIVGGTIITKYNVQGGSSMLNLNFEVRFPIYKSFEGVIFQDAGVLSQSGISGFRGKWYPSAGFGLRYKTPIGPIRFDIGWKWKKVLPEDSSYAWYLTLGEAF